MLIPRHNLPMKIALGLFHFNPHWNLDPWSGRRHCTEALTPLLRTLCAHPKWRVTIEMAGSGLEFVHRSYPGTFAMLRRLIDRGQVDLISALYTPNLWVAFPRSDLRKSVELNRKCLDKLGLPASRIFFAQEGFFGPGVAAVADSFDVALCKDDCLTYYYDANFRNPCFAIDGMRVLIMSGHLISELHRFVTDDPDVCRSYRLTPRHLAHINTSNGLNDANSFPCMHGQVDGVEWLWYHCGDGNHFGATAKPDDLERSYYDPIWASLCIGLLESYETAGFTLGTVQEFYDQLDYSTAQRLPPLPEGSWNSRRSQGVRCWMGQNRTVWEDDSRVLVSVARSRARIIVAESALALCKDETVVCAGRQLLDEAWGHALHAEISDSVGWFAGPQAVQTACRSSEQAFITANQVLDSLLGLVDITPFLERPIIPAAAPQMCELPNPEIFGGQGTCNFGQPSASGAICQCDFVSSAPHCGVRFPFLCDELVYCPTACEETPAVVPLGILKAGAIVLPLSNGLLQIAPGMFLIKDISTVHIAATIDPGAGVVEFGVLGSKLRRLYKWTFHVFIGSLKDAVEYRKLHKLHFL